MAFFRAFSEVGMKGLTSEKARLFYMETYLLRKCVSGCDLGLDNANCVCGLDVTIFERIFRFGNKSDNSILRAFSDSGIDNKEAVI